MESPPDPLQIPEGFLQLCIKFEYFKRNSALDAHLNVCQMINSKLREDRRIQFPDLEPEFNDDPPPDTTPLNREFISKLGFGKNLENPFDSFTDHG